MSSEASFRDDRDTYVMPYSLYLFLTAMRLRAFSRCPADMDPLPPALGLLGLLLFGTLSPALDDIGTY